MNPRVLSNTNTCENAHAKKQQAFLHNLMGGSKANYPQNLCPSVDNRFLSVFPGDYFTKNYGINK